MQTRKTQRIHTVRLVLVARRVIMASQVRLNFSQLQQRVSTQDEIQPGSRLLSPPFFFFSLFPLLFSRATLFWIERLRLISWSQQCCHYWFWTPVFTACLAWLSTLSLPRMPECEQEAWMNGTLRTRFYYRSWMCCHYFCVISSWSYVQSARRSLSLHWFFLR